MTEADARPDGFTTCVSGIEDGELTRDTQISVETSLMKPHYDSCIQSNHLPEDPAFHEEKLLECLKPGPTEDQEGYAAYVFSALHKNPQSWMGSCRVAQVDGQSRLMLCILKLGQYLPLSIE